MANPEPIQQRIEVTADTSGAAQVSRSLDEVQQQTQEGARAAIEAARSSGTLDEQLRELTRTQLVLAEAEDDHRQKLAQGLAVTEADTQASAQRTRQLTGVSAALEEEAQRTARVNAIIAQSAEAVRQLAATEAAAQPVAEARAATLGEMRQRLLALVTAQQAHDRAVASAGAVTDEATIAAATRQAEIDRLAATIREQQAAEAQAAEAVRRLTVAEEQAVAVEQTRELRLAQVKREIEDLVRAQVRYEQEVKDGAQATDQAQREEAQRISTIDRLGRELAEEERIQERATDAVRRHRAAQDDMGTSVDGLRGRLASMVAGIVGTGGVVRALQLMGEELEKRIQQTRDLAEASLNLQFLSTTFDPQEREFVNAAAQVAGESPVDTARAYTEARSFFPNLAKEDVQSFFLQTAESARTTDAPLSAIVRQQQGLFAVTRDENAAQNIARETAIQAGVGDPEILTNVLGKLLAPLIEVGRVNPGQAAGLAAGVTGLDTRSPEEQATGLRSVVLALLGDLSDEQLQTVQEAKIDQTDAITALKTLGEAIQAGRLDNAKLESVVGAEGLTTAVSLADPQRRSEFFAKVEAVNQAGLSDRDLTQEAIDAQFKADPVQALNFALRQGEAEQTIKLSGDADALRGQLSRDRQDIALSDAQASIIARSIARFIAFTANSAGLSPEASTDLSLSVLGGAQVFSAGQLKKISERVKSDLGSVDETGFLPGSQTLPSGPQPEPEPLQLPSTPNASQPPTAPNAQSAIAAPAQPPPQPAPAERQSLAPVINIYGNVFRNGRDPLTDIYSTSGVNDA